MALFFYQQIFIICMCIFVRLKNFSLILRRDNYQWRASNVYLYWALMVILKHDTTTINRV